MPAEMLSGRPAFGVLGPLEMVADGVALQLGPAKQRAVLAFLVINRNRVVSNGTLVDAVWGDNPPRQARASLHTYISNLRRRLNDAGVDGRSVLSGAASGYRVAIADTDCDLGRFSNLRAAGIRAAASGEFPLAGRHLRAAVAEWRGRPLEDLAGFAFVGPFATALAEDEIGVHTVLAESEIACGRADMVIGPLESLVAEHPYREQLWTQLITAYYVAERQSDALDAFRRLNSALVEDLGIGPGPTARALHERILRQEVLDVRRSAMTAASTAAKTLDRPGTPTRRGVGARLRAPSGQLYPVSGVATRIGRLADNDVVLDDADVSRHHAVVSDTGTAFVITDLRSSNGVYVDGSRVRGSVMLADRDRIQIGGHEFIFEIDHPARHAVGRQNP